MNQETRLRLMMTPDVLDSTGMKLFERAKAHGCGARFTGAGGESGAYGPLAKRMTLQI